MKKLKLSKKPKDSDKRKKNNLVICYPLKTLKVNNFSIYQKARKETKVINEIIVPPREAKCFNVKAGNFFKIQCVDGAQVGDLNLFKADNLKEKFYSGKTRALHGTHLSTGDHLWSSFPYLRPLATITWDTLDWYGFDIDGASVHDVIGTRCDPYTSKLLNNNQYHHCCHSNLIRALVKEKNITKYNAESLVHDVLNVFMCTGFTKDTHQYFMKASPVRSGDFLEFFAETDLLGVLSSCPGGDCGSGHSSDKAKCYPLKVSILHTNPKNLEGWTPSIPSSYNQKHGLLEK
tara:strand:+ start:567 stop:1436 length:870 start_codon:yes stop_codon:yes gene_type:complete